MATRTNDHQEALQPGEFIEELEGIRAEWRERFPFRIREIMSQDEFPRLAEAKRRAHMGGDINHRFEGERYLSATDKASRRFQLRKLVDEGGQETVGGPQVSHPMLSRWESYAYGVTPEEVDSLEKGDCDPGEMVRRGWWISFMRESHFGVAIGSGMVMEGENKIQSDKLLEAIERDRQRFIEWGVEDPKRALENRHEHAGIDIDHADFNEAVARSFVNTPELQEDLRKAYILRLQMTSGG